ncbi:hypothetical protein FACS1894186_1990 [Alphaproteobacteria bacterium]|nr:hypothetical protein FACS1894186_1990 [Alphaproteobacteria bacterium]
MKKDYIWAGLAVALGLVVAYTVWRQHEAGRTPPVQVEVVEAEPDSVPAPAAPAEAK